MPWSRCVPFAALVGAAVSVRHTFSKVVADVDFSWGVVVIAIVLSTPFMFATFVNYRTRSNAWAVLAILAIVAAVSAAFWVFRNEPSPNGSDGLRPLALLIYQWVILGAVSIPPLFQSWLRVDEVTAE